MYTISYHASAGWEPTRATSCLFTQVAARYSVTRVSCAYPVSVKDLHVCAPGPPPTRYQVHWEGARGIDGARKLQVHEGQGAVWLEKHAVLACQAPYQGAVGHICIVSQANNTGQHRHNRVELSVVPRLQPIAMVVEGRQVLVRCPAWRGDAG